MLCDAYRLVCITSQSLCHSQLNIKINSIFRLLTGALIFQSPTMVIWSKCTLMQIHTFITIRNIWKIINGFYEPIWWIVFNVCAVCAVCEYILFAWHSHYVRFILNLTMQTIIECTQTHTCSPFDVCNKQHLRIYLIFEIKRISFAYLVAFMLKIIMTTWTSWQMTATTSNSTHSNRNKQTHTHTNISNICTMGSSPLCKCNCLFSFFFWFRLIFITFPLQLSIVLKPDGKWHYV